jgi:GT2 family glycosyltransferase
MMVGRLAIIGYHADLPTGSRVSAPTVFGLLIWLTVPSRSADVSPLNRRPTVSVVICTYTESRWALMLKAIESVRQQSVPVDELVVVVDHNPALVARFRAHDPSLRVIENREQQGLSGGRNTGIASTTGDYIAFLDDDAVAAPDWIEKMSRHLLRPEVLGVGSRVDPAWFGAPVRWFPDEFLWVVGCTYRGLPKVAGPVRNLTGCSMLVRRTVFDQAGGFSHRLGRTSSKLPLGGEETELCIRAQQVMPGSIFMHEPETSIAHHVSTDRMTWAYLCLRCYAEGLSKATLARMIGGHKLSAERQHTMNVLPAGIAKGLGDAFIRFDFSGLARAAAIALGFASAAFGYVIGQLLDM